MSNLTLAPVGTWACRNEVNISPSATVVHMTPRLPRYTRVSPVTAGWEIEKANRDRFNAIAAHNGMSGGAMLDQLIVNLPLDQRGRPVWLPAVPTQDGELPIDAA